MSRVSFALGLNWVVLASGFVLLGEGVVPQSARVTAMLAWVP